MHWRKKGKTWETRQHDFSVPKWEKIEQEGQGSEDGNKETNMRDIYGIGSVGLMIDWIWLADGQGGGGMGGEAGDWDGSQVFGLGAGRSGVWCSSPSSLSFCYY